MCYTECNQLEDPRLEWRSIQEAMLKEYLQTAKDDLEAKKEILDIKQQRLTIAQDEFHLLRHAYTGLDASRTSREFSFISIIISFPFLVCLVVVGCFVPSQLY